MLAPAPQNLAVTYQNVPEDVQSLCELALARSRLYGAIRYLPNLLIVLMVLLVFQFFLTGRPPTQFMLPLMVLEFVTWIVRDAERLRVRLLAERSAEIARDRATVVISPAGLEFHLHEEPGRVADLRSTDHVHWYEIERLVADDNCLFLFYRGRARAIPRRAFYDPGASDRFLAAARQWHAAAMEQEAQ